ncbi:MAG TPA: beta-ketoacyl synthase N-terminal-like domain-containing protein [Polyangiaceae bacterium]|jgi:3-oxoacyl-[acyl-carrier-protein] synthase-1/3-oxoacyl-[acyl-carrier-protein] synthase II
MSAAILAFGAISGLGRGAAAASVGEVGEPARIVAARDEELAASKLARPFCARADVSGDGDRAAAVLRVAMGDLAATLDARDPAWRSRRVGLALATSSGGMRSAETLFRALHDERTLPRDEAERATYFAPMVDVLGGARFAPATLVLTACAASTIAIGIALGWLEGGACDLVIAGGFDAVSVFVASGFETLRATTASLPSRPFGLERDGMCLGEGAALFALVRADSKREDALGYVTGFGASGDAVHVTAPDRTGAGLARAASRALGWGGQGGQSPPLRAEPQAKTRGESGEAARGRAAPDQIDLVSAHGTATPFNDAAEWKAITAVLGARATEVAVHPFKAQIGHTLGAAGALESLAAFDAISRGVVPAAAIPPARDPETPARVCTTTTRESVHSALKLSAAFGGANAALVLRDAPEPSSRPRERSRAFVAAHSHVGAVPSTAELAAMIGAAPDRLARMGDLEHLALAAIAGLARAGHDLRGAGIVVGHAYATVDVNDRYFQRVLERGDARAAEPRRFPYTSPNAVAGECSLAFGLTGPNLAVGSGLHGGLEALAIAADFVRAGDADRMVAVAVDAPRRAARAIAEACGWPIPRDGAVAVLVSRESGIEIVATESATSGGDGACAPGHEALLPLLDGAETLATASPWGAFVKVTLAAQKKMWDRTP